MAGGKRTSAGLGAWICFEDESGQGLRPPKGTHLGPARHHPGGDGDRRQQQARLARALIAIKPGQHPRLIYRVHNSRRRGKDQRKGFTEADYAQLLDAARQQLVGPIVVVWDLCRPRDYAEG